jgi:Flp pilus assembly protein TadG
MSNTATATPVATSDTAIKSAAARLQDDEQGATAVEFAIIAMPFLTMLLGIMSVCLYFFTMLEMENAVWQVSRDIRVGKYGKGTDGYSGLDANGLPILKENVLVKKICEKLRTDTATCSSSVRVVLQSRATISHSDATGSLSQPNCRSNTGDLRPASQFDTPGATSFVVLTGCYTWAAGGKLPFLNIGNMPDGSFLIQSSFAFVNESYN